MSCHVCVLLEASVRYFRGESLKFLIYSAIVQSAVCLYVGHCTDRKVKPQKRGGLNGSVRAAFLSKENEGKTAKKRSRKDRAGKIVKYETFQ